MLSRKGGAGKTTTTLMLGHTFATHRGDRVVALDANPDAGSLGMRLPRETQYSATDLLAERTWVERYSQMRAFTSQDPVSRLEVVASDDDPRITLALGSQDYRHLVDTLDRHYNLVLVDTGTGILDDAIQGILEEADQLVVVMPPALDGGRVAAMTLDWLDQHGHHDLVARSVAVVNAVRGSGPLELDRLEEHFASRCASVHRIPWDPVLEAGAHSALADLRPATRAAYLELAGAVAEGFRSTGHRRSHTDKGAVMRAHTLVRLGAVATLVAGFVGGAAGPGTGEGGGRLLRRPPGGPAPASGAERGKGALALHLTSRDAVECRERGGRDVVL